MTDEAREAAITNALEALDWKSLTTEDMVGFIIGAVNQSKAAGVVEGRKGLAGAYARRIPYPRPSADMPINEFVAASAMWALHDALLDPTT